MPVHIRSKSRFWTPCHCNECREIMHAINSRHAYGKVEDLRINTKSGGGRLPNFGFVVFEKPETVQEILRIKNTQPIKYNNEHRLNVEEKKPRGSDGIRSGGRGMSRGGGMGGQGMGGGRSGSQYGNGRGGMKGGFGRQEMRGSPNLGGPRGGGMSQGRR